MKKVEVKPTIIRDDEGNYTIVDLERNGGAIISDLDPFVALSKFKEATYLAFAVRNFLSFANGGSDWRIPVFE